MESSDQKVCPHCAETIKAAAKICPHCQIRQSRHLDNFNRTFYFMHVFLAVTMAATGWWLYRMYAPKHDFVFYSNQVTILSSTVTFHTNSAGYPQVNVLGTLSNGTALAWKDVQIEAQLFDSKTNLVDVIKGTTRDTVPAYSESGFEMFSKRIRSQSEYATHKLFIRFAKDAREFP